MIKKVTDFKFDIPDNMLSDYAILYEMKIKGAHPEEWAEFIKRF